MESLRDLICLYDREIGMLEREVGRLLADHVGYRAVQALPGVGRVLAAVFVAEVGDVGRFAAADKLCCWAGLGPPLAILLLDEAENSGADAKSP